MSACRSASMELSDPLLFSSPLSSPSSSSSSSIIDTVGIKPKTRRFNLLPAFLIDTDPLGIVGRRGCSLFVLDEFGHGGGRLSLPTLPLLPQERDDESAQDADDI